MSRPRMRRRVKGKPGSFMFKPAGIQARDIGNVEMTIEEFEAFRLKDYVGLDQFDAAESMDISQPTFCRNYKEAKKKIAKALVEGLVIEIGGDQMPNKDGTGPEGEGPRTGRGKGKCK